MKSLVILIFIVMSFSSGVSGCGAAASIPNSHIPVGNIPTEQVNASIGISSLTGDSTYKNGETFSLVVEVKTKDQISFRSDYNIQVFTLQDDRWVKVQNRYQYQEPKQFYILSLLSPFINKGIVDLTPLIPGLEKRTPVRVVVYGNLVKDNQATDTTAAAYIDLILRP